MGASTNIKAVKAFRRQRLAALLDRYSKVELSRLVDINPDYLWQMGKASGKSARGMNDDNARKIEAALKLPPGWMDAEQDENGATTQISQSDATLTHPSPHQVQRVRVRGIAMVDGEGFWAEVQAAEQDEYVAALGNDPDAYAIKIVGRRYFPVIDSGQCVVASPAAPLKTHKRVLVRLADGRHTVRLYLNHQDGLWMFASLTDANDVLELRDDQVAAVERVVAVSDSE